MLNPLGLCKRAYRLEEQHGGYHDEHTAKTLFVCIKDRTVSSKISNLLKTQVNPQVD